MTDYPFMPVDVAVLLADTATLTTLEFGAYCLLLDHMWLHKGKLPADDWDLARICRMRGCHWQRMKARLMPYLTLEDGTITQKRLMLERSKIKRKLDGKTDARTRVRASKGVKPLKNNKTADQKEKLNSGFIRQKMSAHSKKIKDLASTDARAHNHNYNHKEKEEEKESGQGSAATTGSPGCEGRSPVAPESPQMAVPAEKKGDAETLSEKEIAEIKARLSWH